MANDVETYNEQKAWAKYTQGFKLAINTETNKAPELRFVDKRTPMQGVSDSAPSMPILDSWVTRYPNGKLGK